MIKKINYLLQSIVIYFFFVIGRLLGLKISRKIFSFLFSMAGPFFKSKKVIKNNINICFDKISYEEKKKNN